MTSDHKTEIRAIRARIDAHAPYPAAGEVTPVALARHFAVTALTRRVRLDCMPVDGDMAARYRETDAACADFGAAVAFWALADKGTAELDLGVPTPLVPDAISGKTPAQVATMVRDIWESGELGEWLWEFLGKDAAEDITSLVGQMVKLAEEAKAAEPATAKVALADLRWALNFMAVDGSHTQGVKDRLTEAAGGHRDLSELRTAWPSPADEAVTGCTCGTGDECPLHCDPAVLEPSEAVTGK